MATIYGTGLYALALCVIYIQVAHQLFHRTCTNHVYDIVLIINFACNFVASILTLDDLNSVYKNLINAAGNWLDLGLDLGLHQHVPTYLSH